MIHKYDNGDEVIYVKSTTPLVAFVPTGHDAGAAIPVHEDEYKQHLKDVENKNLALPKPRDIEAELDELKAAHASLQDKFTKLTDKTPKLP